MSIIIFIVNENQIENINAQNDKKNNKNIVIINKDKCKGYNIVKSKNKKKWKYYYNNYSNYYYDFNDNNIRKK